MRIDTVIKDVRRTLEHILRALSHGLTANENFSGHGSQKNQVLHSTGPDTAPEWVDPSTIISDGGAGPPFKPLNADDLVSGTVPSGRMEGQYEGITRVGTLDELRVESGIWMHSQFITKDVTVPAGWGSPLVGPIDVATGVTFDIAGVVEILG